MDLTKIPGYSEELSADDVLELIKNYEEPAKEPEPEEKREPAKPPKGFVTKDQLDKALSEVADYKRKLRGYQTEEERKETERQEREEQMQQKLAEFERREKISSLTANYLQQGYEAETAKQIAEALADSDTETMFDLMAKHRTAYEKSVREQIMKSTPVPPASSADDEARKKREMEDAYNLMMGKHS